MANYNNTKLTCNDLQKFIEIMKTNPFNWPHEPETGREVDKDGFAFIQSRNDLPYRKIEQLSKENPDLIFTAEYSCESDWHAIIDIIEYKNGEENQIGQRANYSFTISPIKNIIGDHYDKLLNKAEKIFRQIDTRVDEKGRKYVEFVDEEIILTVQDDDFQMQVSKNSCMIEVIKCFEKVRETSIKLVPIGERPDPKDSLPF